MNKLIQWNINGAFSHLAELEYLATQQQPFMICLQKCKLKPSEQFDLRNFNTFRFDVANNIDADEVITLVHESAPVVNLVKITTKIPCIVVRVALPCTHSSLVAICNVHISPLKPVEYDELQSLILQLPVPFILVGNFYEDDVLEKLLDENTDLVILNELDEPTQLDRATGYFFVEDVSLSSTDLSQKIQWNIHNDLNDSDHFPVILTFPEEPIYYAYSPAKWKVEDAIWPLFENLSMIECKHKPTIGQDVEFFTETLLNAGLASIPRLPSIPIVKRRVSWWSYKLTAAVKCRQAALNQLRSKRSVSNLCKYLDCCDKARLLMIRAQDKHWENFTSSINQYSPMNSNWKKVQYIQGKTFNPPITAVFRTSDNSLVTDPAEIADVLASHYSAVSSNANYSPEFLEQKCVSEKTVADFSSSYDEYYNSSISMRELEYSLQHHNFHSSPGPDDVHPMMLKYLHESAKKYLLDIYNKIWSKGEFPSKWKLAVIVPSLKKGKEKTQPASYRPVSLTSCLAKVFEKIIQKRLMWQLESKHYWSHYQYGFRKMRSTTQAIADLQLRVKKAFDERTHLYAVFFDLQTASDTLWRHQILLNLRAAGITGRMGLLVQHFLKRRKIVVRLGATLSKTYVMENGLPQGSVLSETLLLVALNNIQYAVKPPVNFSLFVDDLVITYESSVPSRAQDVIQKAIDDIISWASEHGFKFSAEKTTSVDFYRGPKHPHEQPELFINDQKLHFSDTVSYLGLTFDSRLSWTDHIGSLKEICYDILDVLEKIDNGRKGGDQKILLRVYTSLIKSRLDYGCLAFSSASPGLLAILDNIQNSAIRIATGAYPTSPDVSLNTISGILPLDVGRQLLSANFLASALSTPNLPLNKLLFDENNCIHDKTNTYLGYVTMNFESFLPEFCEFISNPPLPMIFSDPPPWFLTTPVINLNLTEYAKYEDPNELPVDEIRLKFSTEMSKYANFTECFTDGSKTDNQVGAAFSVSSFIDVFKLPKQCSSFTAELVAILKCLEYLISFNAASSSHFIIITDSLNALVSLQDTYTLNPLVQRILLAHNTLIESDIRIVFLWIPGHCGISGNELVDKEARKVSYQHQVTCHLYTSYDVKSYMKSLIIDSWQRSWQSQSSSNQLVPIKPNVLLEASSPFSSKRENDILTRLRISHTHLTHSYLIQGQKQPPVCPFCRNARLLIEHILTVCPVLEKQRTKYNLSSVSMPDLLNESSPHIKNLFMFLDSLNLLHRI